MMDLEAEGAADVLCDHANLPASSIPGDGAPRCFCTQGAALRARVKIRQPRPGGVSITASNARRPSRVHAGVAVQKKSRFHHCGQISQNALVHSAPAAKLPRRLGVAHEG